MALWRSEKMVAHRFQLSILEAEIRGECCFKSLIQRFNSWSNLMVWITQGLWAESGQLWRVFWNTVAITLTESLRINVLDLSQCFLLCRLNQWAAVIIRAWGKKRGRHFTDHGAETVLTGSQSTGTALAFITIYSTLDKGKSKCSLWHSVRKLSSYFCSICLLFDRAETSAFAVGGGNELIDFGFHTITDTIEPRDTVIFGQTPITRGQ